MAPKYTKMLWKGLAILGGIVAAVIFYRSYQKSQATKTGLVDNLQSEVKDTFRLQTPALVLLSIAAGFATLWLTSMQASAVGLMVAYLWGSVAASTSGSFNITYVPQYIGFTIASAPTSFIINVQGDGVIFNLDANGNTVMKNIRMIGVVSNTYIFQLANGLINGKNGTVTITNAAAAQLDVYAWSQQPGNYYMTYLTQNALASSGIQLTKFAYAGFPSAAAADLWTISYKTGLTQNAQRNDLINQIGYTQNETTTKYAIDNVAPAIVDSVTFIPAAAQNVYVMQYQAAQGTVNSAVIAKG